MAKDGRIGRIDDTKEDGREGTDEGRIGRDGVNEGGGEGIRGQKEVRGGGGGVVRGGQKGVYGQSRSYPTTDGVASISIAPRHCRRRPSH